MISSHRLRLAWLILFALIQTSLQQSCYFPDGTIAVDDIPCTGLTSLTNVTVPCCGPGRSCLPNKMCSGSQQDGNPSRGSCTDQSWQSDDCPQFCTKYQGGAMIFDCTSRTGVTNADNDAFFCCAGDSPQCCNNQAQLFSAAHWNFDTDSSLSSSTSSSISSSPTVPSTALSSTTSPTLSSSSVSSSSDASSASPLTSVSESLSAEPTNFQPLVTKTNLITVARSETQAPTSDIEIGAATKTAGSAATSHPQRDWTGIGIGVGVGVAVPLIALLIAGPLLWRRYRRRHAISELHSPPMYTGDNASSRSLEKSPVRGGKPAYLKTYEADGSSSYELDAAAGGGRIEMPTKSPRELPGSEDGRPRYQAYQPASFHVQPKAE